jgi:N-methylhydantoinase A
MSGFRIGVDTGGTFTDLVVTDSRNLLCAVAKVPSTPEKPEAAVFHAIDRAAGQLHMEVRELLGYCNMFVHGSTVATNILLEGKGATTGLVCTKGFRDALAIRRGKRQRMWDLQEPQAQPLVPRFHRIGVTERTDRDGRVEISPSMTELDRIACIFEDQNVESVAICLFNSYLNSANEDIVASFLSKRMPDRHISVSSHILPLIGEYERTSTTVLDAYVAPATVSYLTRLKDRLQDQGLGGDRLYVAQSNGGLMDVAGCIERPVLTMLSGPSAAVGAARLYVSELKADDLVVFDMGGTSCDVTLLRKGEAIRRETTSIGSYESALPSVDVHTIGTGGGTLARVVHGGMLRVGPDSVGADPGPACFGRGTTDATVTDANMALGRLDPSRFAQGQLSIDPNLADRAIDTTVGAPTGLSREDAALAIIAVADQHMVEAIRLMTVERGVDPRELVLIGAGGAAGLHVASIARELGVRSAYIPRQAASFCAVGLLQADVEQDWFQSLESPLDTLTVEELQSIADDLHSRAEDELSMRGFDLTQAQWRFGAALRYTGGQTTVHVPVPEPLSSGCVERLEKGFHLQHEFLYGFSRNDSRMEAAYAKLSVRISTPNPLLTRLGVGQSPTPPITHQRRLTLAPGRRQMTDFLDGEKLVPGTTLQGPLIIHDPLTTVLVLSGQSLTVDSSGGYIIKEVQAG